MLVALKLLHPHDVLAQSSTLGAAGDPAKICGGRICISLSTVFLLAPINRMAEDNVICNVYD